MFYQIFLSLQVKRSAIISNEHGINELPNELPNNLRLMVLDIKKGQENLKTPENHNLMTSLPPKIKILLILPKKLLKNRNQNFPVFRYFKWKSEFVSNILWMIAI